MPSRSSEFHVEQLGPIAAGSGGHVIAISFQTANGEMVTLDVPHEALPNLYYLLQAAGANAARQRLAGSSGNDGPVLPDPIHAKRWLVGSADHHLAIRSVTGYGVPLTVAVPRDKAASLAMTILEKAAAKAPRRSQ